MLVGAFFGIWGAVWSGSWVVGLFMAMLFGGLLGLIHAVFSVTLRSDQIVSGFAINFLALGLTGFLFNSIYPQGIPSDVSRVPNVHLAFLDDVPFLGDVFGNLNLLVWIMFGVVILAHVMLFRTPTRPSHPLGRRASESGRHGGDLRLRRSATAPVVASGVLAALGGAFLSIGFVGTFAENMTSGRGFIALAAVIFGKWRPAWAFAATLLFGFGYALADPAPARGGRLREPDLDAPLRPHAGRSRRPHRALDPAGRRRQARTSSSRQVPPARRSRRQRQRRPRRSCERLPRPGETVTGAAYRALPRRQGREPGGGRRPARRRDAHVRPASGDDEHGRQPWRRLPPRESTRRACHDRAGADGRRADRRGGRRREPDRRRAGRERLLAAGARRRRRQRCRADCQLEIPLEAVEAAAERATGLFCAERRAGTRAPRPAPASAPTSWSSTGHELEALDLAAPRGLVAVTLGAEGAMLLEGGEEVARAGAPPCRRGRRDRRRRRVLRRAARVDARGTRSPGGAAAGLRGRRAGRVAARRPAVAPERGRARRDDVTAWPCRFSSTATRGMTTRSRSCSRSRAPSSTCSASRLSPGTPRSSRRRRTPSACSSSSAEET